MKIVPGILVPGVAQARRRERLQEIEHLLRFLAEAKLLRRLTSYLLANVVFGWETILHKIKVRLTLLCCLFQRG